MIWATILSILLGGVVNAPAGGGALVHDTSLDLNGTDEGLRDTVTNRAYGIANAFTVAVWLKADTQTTSMFVFQLNPSGTDNDGTFLVLEGATTNDPIRVVVVDSAGDAKNYRYNSHITDGVWHHIAYTWDGTSLVTYVDGSAVTADTMDANAADVVLTDASRRIQVGWSRFSANFFDGRLHSLAFWSVVLDSTEISTIYNAGEGGEADYSDVEGASLQHWWQIGQDGDIGGDFGVHADPVDLTTNASNITEGDDKVSDYPGL